MWSGPGALINYLNVLQGFLWTHAVLTTWMMVWVVIDHSMPVHFIPVKSIHPIMAMMGIYYLGGGYAKPQLIRSPGTGMSYLRTIYGVFMFFLIAVLISDLVYGGVILIPTLVDCYNDSMPPPTECPDFTGTVFYTITFILAALHVLFEILIAIFAILAFTQAPEPPKVCVTDRPRSLQPQTQYQALQDGGFGLERVIAQQMVDNPKGKTA